ncbi:MAG TPA: DUF2617 family protein [Pseudonocardiaceae bacterium]|nr:DUF2617 family protein [Pseudonocardiaceae bacterium]
MSVHLLDIQPRDVDPDALGLLLHAPAPTALAQISLRDGRGGVLTLGVLGASHVVTATLPGHHLTEQVSCDAVGAGGQELPQHAQRAGYQLTTVTRKVPRVELAETAARLHGLAERSDSWLCATFPGDGSAMTAMTAGSLPAGGWSWESWHLYPGKVRNSIVATQSRWTPP